MAFADILQNLGEPKSSGNQYVPNWRLGPFPKIPASHCFELTPPQIRVILEDLNWKLQNTKNHPVYYNDWFQHSIPITRTSCRGKKIIDKGEVSNNSGRFGYSLIDIKREGPRKIRRVLYLERACQAFSEYPKMLARLQKFLTQERQELKQIPDLWKRYLSFFQEVTPVTEPTPKTNNNPTIIVSPLAKEDTPMPMVVEASVNKTEEIMAEEIAETNAAVVVRQGEWWVQPLTSDEKKQIKVLLQEAVSKKLDLLETFIAISHDLDVSFYSIRDYARKEMQLLASSPRGAKTSKEERDRLLTEVENELTTYNSKFPSDYAQYQWLVTKICLQYRIWPRSLLIVLAKNGFPKPTRPSSNRSQPQIKFWPELVERKEKMAEPVSAAKALPATVVVASTPKSDVVTSPPKISSPKETAANKTLVPALSPAFSIKSRPIKKILISEQEQEMEFTPDQLLDLIRNSGIKLPANARLSLSQEGGVKIVWPERKEEIVN